MDSNPRRVTAAIPPILHKPDPTVAVLRQEHAEGIRPLLLELLMEQFGANQEAKTCDALELILDDLLDGVGHVKSWMDPTKTWVLLNKERVIGLATMVARSDELAEIKRIGLTKSMRGLGYSYILLRRLEEEASARGFRQIGACLLPSQTAATAFYLSAGFELVGNNQICLSHLTAATRFRSLLVKSVGSP